MDLEYYTELTIGGQKITGVVDTTSFELVVFSSRCKTCGSSGLFDAERSPTFVQGAVNKTYYYETGSCSTTRANDTAQLGCYSTQHQAMWFADRCHLPPLKGGFQSIVGVGPPGQPGHAALEALKQLDKLEDAVRGAGKKITSEEDQRARAKIQAELDDALHSKALLDNFGMRTFSICLGKSAGSPAWMVWNDVTRKNTPGTLRLPAVGDRFWGLSIAHMALEFPASSHISNVGEMAIGCEKGCGAVVDTGSSFLAVPDTIYRAIADMLEAHLEHSDCHDLSPFPTLVISVGDHKLRLPPSSYIGHVSGQPNHVTSRFMRTTPKAHEGCVLLLLDHGDQETQFGPLVVLGMPLFREYYTTFDLGSGGFGPDVAQRAIFVTPADESCDPDQSASVGYAQDGKAAAPRHVSSLAQVWSGSVKDGARDREAVTPRQVSLAHVRAPHWLLNRKGVDI